jgi:hypothetical protein
MNIFYLDEDFETAAKMHLDKHVVKMIIEYAQLMSTAHRMLDGDVYIDDSSGRKMKRWRHPSDNMDAVLYKASHINHPSAIWTRSTFTNYLWLYSLWEELCKEYTYRYGKVHLTQQKLQDVLNMPPSNISDGPLTKMPQAMPDDVKMKDSIAAYRNYYRTYKMDMARYTKRDFPDFMVA